MTSFVGKVVSARMQKSVVVAVDRVVRHPKYPAAKRRTKKFMAHDERNDGRVGDQVKIDSSRPLSKRKHWVVAAILRRESIFHHPDAALKATTVLPEAVKSSTALLQATHGAPL
eukprot:SM000060S19681  [mRNA]  locus=s60:523988:524946:+ [translate_table: standard]